MIRKGKGRKNNRNNDKMKEIIKNVNQKEEELKMWEEYNNHLDKLEKKKYNKKDLFKKMRGFNTGNLSKKIIFSSENEIENNKVLIPPRSILSKNKDNVFHYLPENVLNKLKENKYYLKLKVLINWLNNVKNAMDLSLLINEFKKINFNENVGERKTYFRKQTSSHQINNLYEEGMNIIKISKKKRKRNKQDNVFIEQKKREFFSKFKTPYKIDLVLENKEHNLKIIFLIKNIKQIPYEKKPSGEEITEFEKTKNLQDKYKTFITIKKWFLFSIWEF